MSDKPLPFSNGLQLKSMGAVLLLVLGVLIWRLTDATTTTARVLYIAAIVFELLFFVGLVFASRFIKNQHDKAEAAYRAQVAAQAEAARKPSGDDGAAPAPGPTDVP
ncbi:hypothetical protein HWD35_20575 [Tsukamurella tyrosinosolvens]|uniref:hypothetical protein n=1 Tax=Tsukamurella tyrosinosolvens TaxID=57704 RepID=UPI000793F00B|nr:hypothetical protein [Tsukamurella tyrosinosolvens]KXP02793.1 hypothetical protein AXK59_20115 [Tsukamurella tyrosinosolvens]KZL96992.1 hypothetical protein AXX05_16075 [Tsukamurella tyrosinosolvens]MCA4997120.1 hypothetical protein [Tsukamurella tyrosinosolvens]WEL94159.1 hypothetical protein P1N98_04470 [Tsukamurella tyrosinosolvens]